MEYEMQEMQSSKLRNRDFFEGFRRNSGGKPMVRPDQAGSTTVKQYHEARPETDSQSQRRVKAIHCISAADCLPHWVIKVTWRPRRKLQWEAANHWAGRHTGVCAYPLIGMWRHSVIGFGNISRAISASLDGDMKSLSHSTSLLFF